MPARSRRGFRTAAALVAAAVLVACSSSPGGGTRSAAGPSATGSVQSSAQRLASARTGLVTALPTTNVTITKDVDLWIVSCGQLVETCSGPAAAATAAAKELGWRTHQCDGQLNQASVSTCVRQATAARATAIDVIGFDCLRIKQSLVEANAAGIRTVGGGGFDCAEFPGGTQVYSGTLHDAAGMTNREWWATLGRLQADWVIGTTGGRAKVLSVQFSDESWGADLQDGFATEIATCPDCSILRTLRVGGGDIAAGAVRTKLSTALLQTPTANAVNVPVDGLFQAGLAQAVLGSGRASTLSVVGAFGGTPNLGYVRGGGGENATAAFSGAQTGWASVDIVARLLAGQTAPGGQFPEGIGIRVVDRTANLPPAGRPYEPAVDFRAAYRTLWGIG